MTMPIKCPKCKSSSKVTDDLPGGQSHCKKCVFTFPTTPSGEPTQLMPAKVKKKAKGK